MTDDTTDERHSDIALEEARRAHDHQLSMSRELTEDSIEFVKVNLLLASVLFTAVRFGQSSQDLLTEVFPISILIFSAAVLLAFVAYLRLNKIIGFDREGIKQLTSGDIDTEDVLPRVYARWTDSNRKKIQRSRTLLVWSLALTGAGLGVSVGVLLF